MHDKSVYQRRSDVSRKSAFELHISIRNLTYISPPFYLYSHRYYINKHLKLYTYLGGDLKKYKGEVGTLILLDVISDMHLYYHCDNF